MSQQCKHGSEPQHNCYICRLEKELAEWKNDYGVAQVRVNELEAELTKEREANRPELRWFAVKMESKLQANDHKGGWKRCTKEYLIGKLKEEVQEVLDELSKASPTNKNQDDVIAECADASNILMMIADIINLTKEGNEPNEGTHNS